MALNDKIKVCPFCGSGAVSVFAMAIDLKKTDSYTVNTTRGFGVGCRECRTSGPVDLTERKAIKKWNKAKRRAVK